MGKKREIGGFRQMLIMMHRNAELIFNNKIKMGMIILFPVVIGFLLSYVSRNDTFKCFENGSSCLFAITCAVIYIGMFNSLTEICKERNVIKREYMTNMKIPSYIMAIMLVQAIVCLFQSIVMTTICYNLLHFPKDGEMQGSYYLYYVISFFLIMYASDAMGILISSIVKTNELANLIAPIIIIVQLVLSGVLFDMDGGAIEVVSKLTVSKWGMSALGRIADLNSYVPRIIFEDKSGQLKGLTDMEGKSLIPMPDYEEYVPGILKLLEVWGVLLLFIVIFAILSMLFLKRVEKDSR